MINLNLKENELRLIQIALLEKLQRILDEEYRYRRNRKMKFDNLPNLNKGQIIRVFPFNGGKVEGEFAGIACGNLLLSKCSVKNRNSICHKVNNAFVPIDDIKRIECYWE